MATMERNNWIIDTLECIDLYADNGKFVFILENLDLIPKFSQIYANNLFIWAVTMIFKTVVCTLMLRITMS